jgi:hypothetical protein
MHLVLAVLALLVCTGAAAQQAVATQSPPPIALAASAASAPAIRVQLEQKSDSLLQPGVVSSVVTGLVALTVLLVQRRWHQRDQDRLRSQMLEEREHQRQAAERGQYLGHVLSSMEFLEGGTQKRSVALAVIEANWNRFPDLQDMWISALTNQAVYLLCESNRGNAAHELANFHRIIRLLQRGDDRITGTGRTALKEALRANIDGKGLRGIREDDALRWISRLGLGNFADG